MRMDHPLCPCLHRGSGASVHASEAFVMLPMIMKREANRAVAGMAIKKCDRRAGTGHDKPRLVPCCMGQSRACFQCFISSHLAPCDASTVIQAYATRYPDVFDVDITSSHDQNRVAAFQYLSEYLSRCIVAHPTPFTLSMLASLVAECFSGSKFYVFVCEGCGMANRDHPSHATNASGTLMTFVHTRSPRMFTVSSSPVIITEAFARFVLRHMRSQDMFVECACGRRMVLASSHVIANDVARARVFATP